MNNLYVNENTRINETAERNGDLNTDMLGLNELLGCDMAAAGSGEAAEAQETLLASKAQAKLIVLANRYRFMLDTCALLHQNFGLLLEHLLPLLQEVGKTLLIPFCVVLELKGIAQRLCPEQEAAREVIHTLLELKRTGLVSICGEAVELTGDKQKVATVIGQMKEGEVLFVTQNRRLSQTLMDVSRMGLAGGNVGVGCINGHGYVSRFRLPGNEFVPGVRPDGSKVWQRSTCVDCGDQFTIFDRERDYYLENNLALPHRCPLCRKLRKLSWNGKNVGVAV